jgi:Tc toxin complex TcA C-terminal TcB-binding domain/Neuraminidase-like domain/Salmonella virulence plasmid 28.1kDa A protein/Putative peptidoglycan binding domain
MQLQGRNLKANMRGDDVRLLQAELGELGLPIPAAERERAVFGDGTLRAVLRFQGKHLLRRTGVVDQRTALVINREVGRPAEAAFMVRGRVTQDDGNPVRDAPVRATAKGVTARQDKALGGTRTGTDGAYRITYEPADGASPDLVVEVLGGDDGQVVTRSPLVVEAAIDQVVDLVVESEAIPNESEFTQMAAAIDPLLDGADLGALDGASVSYLTGKTTIDPLRIAQYAQARRFASEGEVPAEAYYGLLRANLAPNRAALAAQDNGTLVASLKEVAAAGIIDARLAEDAQASRIVERLNREVVGRIIAEGATPDGRTTLGAYLDIARLNQQQKRTLVEALLEDNEAHADEFWTGLADRPGFNQGAVRSAQLASQLGTLTQDNAPLAKALHARISGAGDEPLRELVKLRQDDWLELIRAQRDQAGNPILPAGLPAVEGMEPAAVYARTMARMVEDAYPTAALAARVEGNAFEGATALRDFLAGQPAFELGRESVRRYLRANDVNLGEPQVQRLEAVQRVFNLAPRLERTETVTALVRKRVTSAVQVRSMGLQQFSKTFEAELGRATAQRVYAAASQQVATVTALYAKYGTAFGDLSLPVVPKLHDEVAGLLAAHPSGVDLPTWERLFGSANACTCEHCDSVFSPSAYLVAILKFLRDRGALGKLFDRRRDIGTIELNCHNTNTTLPYVDLVNEVLEKFLVPSNVTYQTEGEAPALRVHPEHLDPDAYDLLETRVFPWTAPYSLWGAEARGYLEPLGVARHEIMDHLNTTPPLERDTTAWLPIATELLGLTTADQDILLDAAFRPPRWNGHSVAVLRTVQPLLDTARIGLLELRQLIGTRFVNHNGVLELDHTVGEGDDAELTCDLSQVQIRALAGTHLQRVERFTRLRRKLGWKPHELDAVIVALGGEITEELLVNLAFLRQLYRRFRMPLLDLASWFADLDTHPWLGDDDQEHRSRYASIFLNRTVGGEDELAAFDLARLATGGEAIDDHEAAILAGLQIITAEELALIRERRLADGVLNLANLSELYRVATMKRAMRLPVRELLDLIDLSGVDPFDRTEVAGALRLADLVTVIKESGFSIPELVWLLAHVVEPNSRFVPRDDEIEVLMAELRRGLQRIQADFATVPDPSGEATARMLGIVLSPADLPAVLGLIYGVGAGNELPADPTAVLDAAFASFITDDGARANVIARLTDDTDAGFLQPEVQQAERFALVLEPLAAHLRRVNTESFIQQKFADFLEVDLGASDQLLGGLMRSVADPGQPASAVFVDGGFLEGTGEITPAAFPDQFATVIRLRKAAMLINGLGIASEELAWVVENHATLGWLDVNSLPLVEEDGTARFQQWLAMAQAAAFRETALAGSPLLYELLRQAEAGGGAAEMEAFLGALADRTRWNRADLDTLIDGDHLDVDDFGADWGGGRTLPNLLRLQQCFRDLRQLGVSAEMAWSWTAPAPTRAMAAEIKQAARAKYTESQWLNVAEPIRDELRRQQRTALVDAVIDKIDDPAIKDTNDLFAFFLMDVEMNPCMATSRIVFAAGAVQLFVQRCLLRLEDGVELTTADVAMWAWMKNYRVWEAALRVFVTPENWIEPELRPQPSPLFKALEDELLQQDVTDESAELAYLHYLEGLDEVARLQVVGAWNDEETKTFHVVARTKGTPHKFFYRQWYEARRWTPWEEVPVEIEAETATPVVYNRRLYLFWFTTQVLAVEEVPGGDSGQEPNRYLQIRLAWSQFRQRKWSPKRISDRWIQTDPTRSNPILLRPAGYRPRPVIRSNGDLLIAAERSDALTGKTFLDSARFATVANFLFVHDGQIELEAYDQREGGTQLPSPVEGGRSWAYFYRSPGGTSVRMRGLFGFGQKVFDRVPFTALITVPLQYTAYDSTAPFFFEDRDRSYFVTTRHIFGPRPGIFGDITVEPPPFEVYIDRGRSATVRDVADGIRPGGDVIDPSPIRPAEVGAGPLPVSDTVGAINPVVLAKPTLHVHGGGPPILAGGLGEVRFRSRTAPLPGALLGDRPGPAGAPLLLARAVPLAGMAGPAPVATAGGSLALGEELAIGNAIMELGGAPGSWGSYFSMYRRTVYTFHPYYHPYVDLLIKQLNRHGPEGILDPLEHGEAHGLRRQLKTETPADGFTSRYDTGDRIDTSRPPVEEFDFEYGTAYSLYNWELFFHVPFLIANRLSQNRRFAEAQKWYHYIFDPTDNSAVTPKLAAQRFWKIKPFFLNTAVQTIEEMLRLLSSNAPADRDMRERLEAQIRDWRENPFQPHLVAEQRPVAYQKAIVMRYLDNLIAWGDQLFRQDTMESVNEATQLYVLAAELLGKRPDKVPPPEGSRTLGGQPVRTFNDLEPHLDELGNVLIRLENEVGGLGSSGPPESLAADDDGSDGAGPPAAGDLVAEPPVHEIVGSTLFFCVPRNEKLIGYWDTVADRLFKIRNCMNIEGVERQLALFAPPIDPALLVRAAAAGVDLSSVLNDLYAPRPHYRFATMLQRAVELTGEVRQLGSALLQAVEKRDAEDLALLRHGHEQDLLDAVAAVRRKQVDEAKEALAATTRNLEAARARHQFHANRKPRIPNERLHLSKMESAVVFDGIAQGYATIGSALALIPEFDIGAEGGFSSPVAKAAFGGKQLAQAVNLYKDLYSLFALVERYRSQRASVVAGFDRRQEEWDFQAAQAELETKALERQVVAAEIRKAITDQELGNTELQIEHAKRIEEFLRSRFTSMSLYSWMVTQVSTIYFQAYELAYDMAKRAEKACQHELGDLDASFIRFGYWDSLKRGLLAGERLAHDLRRMESAWYESNRRELELTRHVSVAQIDPAALIELRETGTCEVEIPEALFNLDYPGHYLRRLKSVSLTIPCVTGPFTGVNCTLTLLGDRIRVNTVDPHLPYTGVDDQRFLTNTGGIQSIATSTGQNDGGLFEISLRDERYLPFEAAGAISRWRIELTDEFRSFDYDTITDAVFHLRYTARDGGAAVRRQVVPALTDRINEIVNRTDETGLYHFSSLRQEYPTQFHRLLHPTGPADHETTLTISRDRFPYLFAGRDLSIERVVLLLKLRDPDLYDTAQPLAIELKRGDGDPQAADLEVAAGAFGGLPNASYPGLTGDLEGEEAWTIHVTAAAVSALPAGLRRSLTIDGSEVPRLRAEEIEDIGLLLRYRVS